MVSHGDTVFAELAGSDNIGPGGRGLVRLGGRNVSISKISGTRTKAEVVSLIGLQSASFKNIQRSVFLACYRSN